MIQGYQYMHQSSFSLPSLTERHKHVINVIRLDLMFRTITSNISSSSA